jgi:hypothetical protein
VEEIYDMRSKRGVVAVMLGILIAGAALAPSASATSNDACSYLTPAQVSAVVGIPVAAGAYVTPEFKQTCTWNPAGTPARDVRSVTLYVQSADAYNSGKKMMEQMQVMAKMRKADASQWSAASVSGVGDDAYYVNVGTATSLMFKKGSVSFKVSVYSGLPRPEKQAMEKALAMKVLAKL